MTSKSLPPGQVRIEFVRSAGEGELRPKSPVHQAAERAREVAVPFLKPWPEGLEELLAIGLEAPGIEGIATTTQVAVDLGIDFQIAQCLHMPRSFSRRSAYVIVPPSRSYNGLARHASA
jgi:hypothetical protein